MLTTSSSRDRIAADDEFPQGVIQVPAAVSRAIEVELTGRGIPAMGFWARVPQYVGVEFLGAAVALINRIDRHLGLGLDTSQLSAEADAQRTHLDAIAEARPDVAAMVSRLETIVDAAEPASGEELASEIERFLRSQQDEGGIAE